MALLGREFIAVPDNRKGQIVFKWPDITIRRFTRAIVNTAAEKLSTITLVGERRPGQRSNLLLAQTTAIPGAVK